MMNRHLNRALVVAAVSLFGAVAGAEPTKANGVNADSKADKSADTKQVGKPEAKPVTATTDPAGVAKPGAIKAPDPAVPVKAEPAVANATDRAARKTAQHEKLRSSLHGPVTPAITQELRRNAERVARIERIKAIAIEQKDKDAEARAVKLLDKESARHDKFMSTLATTPGQGGGDNAKTEAKSDVKPDTKGGAR